MATVNMLVGQKVTLAIIKTKNGMDADIIGTPFWSSSDSTIAVVTPASDGLTCEVTALATGSATVTASAQGSGPLTANHTIQVAAVNTNLATAMSLTVQSPPE